MDQVYSVQDLKYQSRNINALKCIYPDSLVVHYFGVGFLDTLSKFVNSFPKENNEVIKYLHENEKTIDRLRYFLKGIKYAEDQKLMLNEAVTKLVIESVKLNKCDKKILKENGIKQSFLSLLRLELYLKSRYAPQIDSKKIDLKSLKSSIDLFIESLDKQFSHEYFW